MNTKDLTNEQKFILAAGVALERRARGLPISEAESDLLDLLDGDPDLLAQRGATVETARGAARQLARRVVLDVNGRAALGGAP